MLHPARKGKVMSAKRAAIRRKRKERRKAEHRKAPDGEARRAAEQGRMDGRTLAACIIINVLYDQFGFRDKRLMRMVKQINQEALKFDQEATRFNLEFYAGRLQERIQAAQIRPKVESLTETIYGSVRDEYFISSGAVMFMVLNEYFGKVENIRGLYINTSSNRVIIELEKYNEKEIKKIKENVINSEMISFEQAGSFENIANINPGAQFTSSIGKGCSYGYRAKTSTGQVGIVSAGHCFSGTGNTISGVGTVTMHRNNTTLDAAFIATNSGITPTNTLNQNPPFSSYNTISTTVVSKFSGQRIAKLGYVTGYTVGGIISANYSYTDGNGNTYTNLIRANLLVDNGDSGGVVIETTLTFPNTSYATIGIARSKGNGSYSGQALITKASLINSTFGLSRY